MIHVTPPFIWIKKKTLFNLLVLWYSSGTHIFCLKIIKNLKRNKLLLKLNYSNYFSTLIKCAKLQSCAFNANLEKNARSKCF